jgi:lipopolysaccharide heptosyltransferase II
MNILLIKLGATGDVVRTTPLIRCLGGHIVWITESKNLVLLDGLADQLQAFSWEERNAIPDLRYDLVINLEDTVEVAQFAQRFRASQWFGSYLANDASLKYTDDSRGWFDLSLISVYGREEADRLKFRNRSSYQELIFAGLGHRFRSEEYLLPLPQQTDLIGDVAVAAEAGPVWPMKKWAFYDELRQALEGEGLRVNVLPKRACLLEHLSDVRNHSCLVGGDSLPMHFALGTRTPCVNIFTCTSPWEIYDYGVQQKLISPLLEEFFYHRGYNRCATAAISLEQVKQAVMTQLKTAATPPRSPFSLAP